MCLTPNLEADTPEVAVSHPSAFPLLQQPHSVVQLCSLRPAVTHDKVTYFQVRTECFCIA